MSPPGFNNSSSRYSSSKYYYAIRMSCGMMVLAAVMATRLLLSQQHIKEYMSPNPSSSSSSSLSATITIPTTQGDWYENENDASSTSTSTSTNTSTSSIQQSQQLLLPLQPPFRIIQLGKPRSGSTFQFQLLYAMVKLKTPPGTYKIKSYNMGGFFGLLQQQRPEQSYVFKSHAIEKNTTVLASLQREQGFVIFTSGLNATANTEQAHIYEMSLYNQEKADLEECALCQVDRYKDIFGLNETEIAIVKEYMRLYSVIRQCCGLQMSKYEMGRLNGCDMSINGIAERPENPHCELVNKADIEQQFTKSPIHYSSHNPKLNWVKPGDCAKFDTMVANGAGFNGRRFRPETDCP